MREFIELMREKGAVIDVEECPEGEFGAPQMASRTDSLLLFHDLPGGRAAMNLTATRKALGLALGVDENRIAETLARASYEGEIVKEDPLPMGKADLSRLPVMKFFPGDAGRYITAGIVFSAHGGVENASIHRMLVLGPDRVAARLVEGRHTFTMHREALAAGDVLPVAVAIGVHPAITFASCTRVPKGKELAFAAELMGGEVRVHRCRNGVCVPEAEIVLEGFIGAETAEEGPFVDITGTYDSVRMQPVIRFTGMYARPDAIYHSILPGGHEHRILMGVPYEPVIFRAVSAVTTVKNVVLTTGGCGYFHAVIQIRKNTQGDAKNAILAALAAHTSLKHVVVVDEDIDPADPDEVEYAIATRVRGDRDILIIPGARGSSLDPCRMADGTNVKVGVDATMVLGHEHEFTRAGW